MEEPLVTEWGTWGATSRPQPRGPGEVLEVAWRPQDFRREAALGPTPRVGGGMPGSPGAPLTEEGRPSPPAGLSGCQREVRPEPGQARRSSCRPGIPAPPSRRALSPGTGRRARAAAGPHRVGGPGAAGTENANQQGARSRRNTRLLFLKSDFSPSNSAAPGSGEHACPADTGPGAGRSPHAERGPGLLSRPRWPRYQQWLGVLC